jgi:hypothetical protein
MAKMRGLLSRPKIDNEELASAQSRAAARLADLAERRDAAAIEGPSVTDPSPDVIEDSGIASSAPGDPGPEPAGPRPPIVVEGNDDYVDGDRETVRYFDLMARLREDIRDDDVRIPTGGHVPASSPPGAVLVDAPSAADASPDVIEDGGMTPVVPNDPGPRPGGRPRPPIVVEGDADVVDREDGQVVDLMAPLHDAGGDGRSMPLGEGGVPVVARPKTPIGRSRRSSSRDRPASSSAGRTPTAPATKTTAGSAPLAPAFCPYCALLLQPAPASSHRCVRCRQRIIVKHIEGRAVYLTEAAVPVFVAERRRIAASGRLTRERERWLRLAAAAGAPVQSQARLAAARLSEGVVAAARTLYLTTVDRAFRAAKRDHDWEAASRIRREKATVLYRVAGSPLPPPADLVATFREGVVAELRGIAEISREAELVSASCCDVCRADDRLISRISHELRVPRLPHDGCPRGLCRCRWELAERDRTTMRRYLRRRPRAESRGSPGEPEPTA